MALRAGPSYAPRRSVPQKRSAGNNRSRNRQREGHVPGLLRRSFFPAVAWAFFFVAGMAALAAVSFGLLYGYRYVTISPYFAVKSIEIQGNSRLSSREILDIIDLEEGKNALLVSIDDMEQHLLENPWVCGASIQRRLPDGFTVRITEKEPRFLVLHNGVPHYADISGKLIAAVVPGTSASFHSLEVEKGAEDMLSRLPAIMQAFADAQLPLDKSALSLVRLSTGSGVEMILENNRLAMSIGPDAWQANIARLAMTLEDLNRRGELARVRAIRAHGPGVWVQKEGTAIQPQRL